MKNSTRTGAMCIAFLMLAAFGSRTSYDSQTPNCTPAVSSAGFLHPGIVMTCDQLMRMHKRVTYSSNHYHAGWKQAFNIMQTGTWNGGPVFADLGTQTPQPTSNFDPDQGYQPHAKKLLICGGSIGGTAVPLTDCTNENNDAVAAYTQAMMWFLKGNDQNAKQVV